MLDVYVAHMGFFLCDIKVIGKSAYFGTPELGVDALKAAHSVLAALWRYSDELSAGRKHPLVGSGFVLPTGILGGGYIAVPGECAISLIAKIPPGVELDRVRDGLEAAARSAITDGRVRLEFSYSASRDHPLGGTPFESAPDEAHLSRLISVYSSDTPGSREDRGGAILVGASHLRRAWNSRRLFRARRYPDLPHPGRERLAPGLLRRYPCARPLLRRPCRVGVAYRNAA